MADLDALERVAELLPEEQQGKFFATIARFKHVPEDDEYLLILEAIGFMTLLWQEIPNRISKILAGTEPIRGASSLTEHFLDEIRTTIQESIETPSHQDLKQLAQELKEQQNLFLHAIRDVNQRSPRQESRSVLSAVSVVLFLLGVAIGICAVICFPKIGAFIERHQQGTACNHQEKVEYSPRSESIPPLPIRNAVTGVKNKRSAL